MPNVKIFRFQPPFGGLRGNAQGPFDGKRIVHFLLVITELFFASSHGSHY